MRQKIVSVVEQLWNQTGIIISSEAHIMFKYAVEQFENFDSIADKVEDFTAHQLASIPTW